ncbi:FAD-dependent monooxygenase [Sciscionella sediminilitoris]|uniref:FAD-dependent monooxygenase n=1 Tax=Sciscionella sediminilitoris TaxID=1445613 RepID=UPI00055A54B2|nr:FAD-dependent monooxygenase [Sciscionella sp. SE31]
MAEEVDALIVGGGMSGLSSALFLAHHGVSWLLVERHENHSVHPRLSGLFPRVMEVLRGVGLEQAIRNLDEFDGNGGSFLRAETLAGREIEFNPDLNEESDAHTVTPAPAAICDQDQVEPLLRSRAVELGADIRFGTELTAFDPDEDGVTAVLESGGEKTTVRAAYLLACDGDRSPIRERLGIHRSGPGVLAHQLGVLFRADLSEALRGRRIRICLTDRPHGGSLHVRTGNRWGFGVRFDPERERVADFTEERCAELIRTASGLPELKPEILHVMPWRISALLADHFRQGRVFLVGDAAHVWPATGGYAGQACVLDAHNLAWKLAEVLRGAAGPRLLDSYETERKPVAEVSTRDSLARMVWFHRRAADRAEKSDSAPTGSPEDHLTVAMGYRYHSAAVLGGSDGADLLENPRTPSGLPGTRAPHVTLGRDGELLSTLDLFGTGFVLLAGEQGEPWTRAAHGLSGVTGYRVGEGGDLSDVDKVWAARYGITEEGAVLVRPDGHIGWRAMRQGGAPEVELARALAEIRGRIAA